MINRRGLYFIFFMIVTFLMIYVISAIYTFYTAPREVTEIESENIKLQESLYPYFNWHFTAQDSANKLLVNNMEQLEKDLVKAEFFLNRSKASHMNLNLDMYFTNSNKEYIETLLKNNKSENTSITNHVLEFNPFLNLFTIDGKLSIFTDSNQVSLSNTILDNSFVGQNIDSNIVRYVALFEEGHWHIHKRKILAKKSTSFKKYLASTPAKNLQQNDIKDIRGINYYPQKSPWYSFWSKFDKKVIAQDFKIIKDLNLNTVRIFVPYFPIQDDKWKYDIISKTRSVLDIADSNKLQVILCLFDFYNGADYETWSNQMPYLDSVVYAFKEHPALFSWDIKNEPDLDFRFYGKKAVQDWAAFFIHRCRSIDSTHPITIGWAHSEHANRLSDYVDFISFHDYHQPHTLTKKIQAIRKKNGQKAIMLSEVGMSTYHGIWKPYGNTETNQDRYYQQLNDFQTQTDIPYLAWTLYDFDSIPIGIVENKAWRINPQKKFGIIDKNQKPKDAFYSIKNNIRFDYHQKSYRSILFLVAIGLILLGLAGMSFKIYKKSKL